MSYLHHTPLLAETETIQMIGVFIPIILFMVALIIVVTALYFRNQNRKLWHETARIALEKGQPIPPNIEVVSTKTPAPDSPHRDVKSGLILLAVSAGLYFGRGDLPVPQAGILIPGFIGLALLLNALFTHLTEKSPKTENPNSLPPKA